MARKHDEMKSEDIEGICCSDYAILFKNLYNVNNFRVEISILNSRHDKVKTAVTLELSLKNFRLGSCYVTIS